VRVDGTRGKWVPLLYAVLMSVTVCFEVSVVFIASVSGTRLLESGFNRMSTDAIGFLIREFELAYVATRFQFFSGLLSFFFAVALRTWTTFHGSLGSAMALGIVTFALNMVTYFNESVHTYRFGLLGYAIRTVQLSLSRLTFTPIVCVTLFAFFGFLYYLAKAIRESMTSTPSIVTEAPSIEDGFDESQIKRFEDEAAEVSANVAPVLTKKTAEEGSTQVVTVEVATKSGIDAAVTTGSRLMKPHGASTQPAVQMLTQEDFCAITHSEEWCP
jgi:hypothetical protein